MSPPDRSKGRASPRREVSTDLLDTGRPREADIPCLIVCVKNADGRIVLVNRRFEQTFRLSRDQVIGETQDKVFSPDIAARHRSVETQVLSTGTPGELEWTILIDGKAHVFLTAVFRIGRAANGWLGLACVAEEVSSPPYPHGPAGPSMLKHLKNHAALLLDSLGRIQWWGRGAEQMFGYPETDILNRHVSLLHAVEEVNAGVPDRMLAHATAQQTYESRAWRRRKDGSRFDATATLARLESGEFIEIVCDLTPDAERPLETSAAAPRASGNRVHEELSRSALASLPLHIAVLDREGSILHVNEAWERFALENGASSLTSTGVGANYLEACRRAAGMYSDEASRASAGIAAVLRGDSSGFSLEYPCHSPGKRRWFLLTAAPLRVSQGGAVVAHTDITERIAIEQNLKQTAEFFRALIENASDIVTILDREGTFRYQSPSIQKVLGYDPNELVGSNCFDITHPSDIVRMREALAQLQQPDSSVSRVEFSIRHKNGSWRILEGVAQNAIGNPSVGGIIVTSRDVTDRRQAEVELREAEAALRNSHRTLQDIAARLLEAEERERRRLSRELHDDLNQKLAILAVDAGGLAKTLPQAEAADVEKELRALQSRLTRICGQVRTMAYQLHPSILDDLGLAVAVRSYCAEFSSREGIQVHFLHRHLTAPIDQEQASAVYRITQEALRNIAKHARARTASVSMIGSESGITLIVRDTGVGFRTDGARTRGGLGLTSMEERARMLGGSLEIRSRPGKGTTVTARIPWRRRS